MSQHEGEVAPGNHAVKYTRRRHFAKVLPGELIGDLYAKVGRVAANCLSEAGGIGLILEFGSTVGGFG